MKKKKYMGILAIILGILIIVKPDLLSIIVAFLLIVWGATNLL
jgi:hypothetical protein